MLLDMEEILHEIQTLGGILQQKMALLCAHYLDDPRLTEDGKGLLKDLSDDLELWRSTLDHCFPISSVFLGEKLGV